MAKYDTKFNFNDRVYNISARSKAIMKECLRCEGECYSYFKNKENQICGECYGQGEVTTHKYKMKYYVEGPITIGEIRLEHRQETVEDHNNYSNVPNIQFDNYGPQTEKYKEQYMCYETGISSGTLHDANKLFNNEEDAEKEVEKLNKEEDKCGIGRPKEQKNK